MFTLYRLLRKKTKIVNLGRLRVGGDAPISVQTMTNTDTEDVKATMAQIAEAQAAGADIIRVSVPTQQSTLAIKDIINESFVPIVADVHFNYKRALEAMDAGVHGIRINPGNMDRLHVREVIKSAIDHNCAVRIGINSGSLERSILEQFGEPSPDAIVQSAQDSIKYIEDLGFSNLKISVKSSNVLDSIISYRKLSDVTDYPLHLGVTEAGPFFRGAIKSAIGIGALLADGIGDTIRVSLSSNNLADEIKVGRQILNSLSLLSNSVNIISCPTCARKNINVVSIAQEIEKLTEHIHKKITVSILGCVVNGVGEATQSDIGIFGFQPGIAKIYFLGKEFKTCPEADILPVFQELVQELCR